MTHSGCIHSFLHHKCVFLLHVTCSTADTSALVTEGLLSQCSILLISIGGAIAKGSTNDGLELVRLFKTSKQ